MCERSMYVCERRIYVCVRVEMYVCEWRMYVCESARMNYGLNGPSYECVQNNILPYFSSARLSCILWTVCKTEHTMCK